MGSALTNTHTKLGYFDICRIVRRPNRTPQPQISITCRQIAPFGWWYPPGVEERDREKEREGQQTSGKHRWLSYKSNNGQWKDNNSERKLQQGQEAVCPTAIKVVCWEKKTALGDEEMDEWERKTSASNENSPSFFHPGLTPSLFASMLL